VAKFRLTCGGGWWVWLHGSVGQSAVVNVVSSRGSRTQQITPRDKADLARFRSFVLINVDSVGRVTD